MQLLELRAARGRHRLEFSGLCFVVQVRCAQIMIFDCFPQRKLFAPSCLQGFSIQWRASPGAGSPITLVLIFFEEWFVDGLWIGRYQGGFG